MKTKKVYNEKEQWSEDGRKLGQDLTQEAKRIFYKYQKKGYKLRDIELFLIKNAFYAAACVMIENSQKKRK